MVYAEMAAQDAVVVGATSPVQPGIVFVSRITGPSAIGSEKGICNSMISTPASTIALIISKESSKEVNTNSFGFPLMISCSLYIGRNSTFLESTPEPET